MRKLDTLGIVSFQLISAQSQDTSSFWSIFPEVIEKVKEYLAATLKDQFEGLKWFGWCSTVQGAEAEGLTTLLFLSFLSSVMWYSTVACRDPDQGPAV